MSRMIFQMVMLVVIVALAVHLIAARSHDRVEASTVAVVPPAAMAPAIAPPAAVRLAVQPAVAMAPPASVHPIQTVAPAPVETAEAPAQPRHGEFEVASLPDRAHHAR